MKKFPVLFLAEKKFLVAYRKTLKMDGLSIIPRNIEEKSVAYDFLSDKHSFRE